MKKVLVVGGANGIGLSIATEFAKRDDVEIVHIVDKSIIAERFYNSKFDCHQFDLNSVDYNLFNEFQDRL